MSTSLPGGQPGYEGYEPWCPSSVPTDSSVKRFISSFYEVSDDPDRTDDRVAFLRR